MGDFKFVVASNCEEWLAFAVEKFVEYRVRFEARQRLFCPTGRSIRLTVNRWNYCFEGALTGNWLKPLGYRYQNIQIKCSENGKLDNNSSGQFCTVVSTGMAASCTRPSTKIHTKISFFFLFFCPHEGITLFSTLIHSPKPSSLCKRRKEGFRYVFIVSLIERLEREGLGE